MDISSATLIGMGGVLVAGSSIVIFLVNYRRCYVNKKPEPKVDTVNPVTTVQVWS
jgi:hypothetical protein